MDGGWGNGQENEHNDDTRYVTLLFQHHELSKERLLDVCSNDLNLVDSVHNCSRDLPQG